MFETAVYVILCEIKFCLHFPFNWTDSGKADLDVGTTLALLVFVFSAKNKGGGAAIDPGSLTQKQSTYPFLPPT